jgi:hypothetical protein
MMVLTSCFLFALRRFLEELFILPLQERNLFLQLLCPPIGGRNLGAPPAHPGSKP